jgi:hypothetical protein
MTVSPRAELPEEVRSLLDQAQADPQPGSARVMALLSQALGAVDYPAEPNHWTPLYPAPESLTPAQRAVITVLCDGRFGSLRGYALPYQLEWRQQWFHATTILEKTQVTVTHSGKTNGEPLWRALQLKQLEGGGLAPMASVLNALPCATALAAIGELLPRGGSSYKLNLTDIFSSGELRLVRDLREEGRDWALETASRIGGRNQLTELLSPFVFLALVRARVPIDRRVEDLLPEASALQFRWQKLPPPTYPRFGAADYLELVAALPDERRDVVLGPRMYALDRSWALAVLERYPSAFLAKALLDAHQRDIVELNMRPDRWNAWVEDLRRLGTKHPEFLGAVEASVSGQTRPVELVVLFSEVKRDAAELDELQRAQLMRAGKLWDGKKLALTARLGRGPRDGPEDDTDPFWGSVEFRHIGNPAGEHLFDIALYADGAGIIFKAGARKEIGYMADQQGVVLYKKDGALLMGLRRVVGPKPPAASRKGQPEVRKRRSPTAKKPR